MDQAVVDAERRAREFAVPDYDQRLAAKIIETLPEDRAEARRVPALVDAILNLVPKSKARSRSEEEALGPDLSFSFVLCHRSC
jgi:hypothetical protein